MGTSCGNVFEGTAGVSDEVAARLIGNPEVFSAVFFLSDGEAIAGAFKLGGPDTAPTR